MPSILECGGLDSVHSAWIELCLYCMYINTLSYITTYKELIINKSIDIFSHYIIV